ncbi:MAG: class I SAM-dependent methyltransferase [Acidimicrobiia bacterium]
MSKPSCGPGDRQEQANRAFWDADADDYQAVHGAALARRPKAWGVWRIPDRETGFVGDVRGLRVLELGCGAGQWAAACARDGAQVVGIDLSISQLRHAQQRSKGRFGVVNTTATALALRNESFDLVLSDHGAVGFCDPELLLAEVHRVLRPGGALVFCIESALHALTWNEATETNDTTLHRPLLESSLFEYGGGTLDTVLSDAGWMRALRRHGFAIAEVMELTPPDNAATTYVDWVPVEWARQWPAEVLWRAVRI